MTTAQTTQTQTQAELEENYDFPQDQTPPDPVPAVAADETPAQPPVLEALLKSKLTIIIQLFPTDGQEGFRQGVLGVRIDEGKPSIVSMDGDEIGPLPTAAWKLLEAQAAIAAAKTSPKPATKATPAPAASKPKQEPAAAAKPKVAPPVIQRPEPKPAAQPQPAPVAAKADMDDIYSLFDL